MQKIGKYAEEFVKELNAQGLSNVSDLATKSMDPQEIADRAYGGKVRHSLDSRDEDTDIPDGNNGSKARFSFMTGSMSPMKANPRASNAVLFRSGRASRR